MSASTDCPPYAEKFKMMEKDHWVHGLQHALDTPGRIIKKTEHVSVVIDSKPKGKYHYLIICPTILSIDLLRKEHVGLIQHMIEVGNDLVSAANKDEENNFKMGFHAIPSMAWLHLHVISDDFDAVTLRHQKHWNSFTTEYLIPPEKIKKQLEENGRVSVDVKFYEQLLKKDLACHVCGEKAEDIDLLKDHVRSHFKKNE